MVDFYIINYQEKSGLSIQFCGFTAKGDVVIEIKSSGKIGNLVVTLTLKTEKLRLP